MENLNKNTMMFLQLIGMFQQATMQHLGKIKNPVTDKIERNLQEAESTIELLVMLKEKTKGNLSVEESRYFDFILQEVKLNFVEEKQKG